MDYQIYLIGFFIYFIIMTTIILVFEIVYIIRDRRIIKNLQSHIDEMSKFLEKELGYDARDFELIK